MKRSAASLILCVALTLGATLALGACGGPSGDGEREIKGLVTGVDAGAKTFTVQGDDGRSYAFRMVEGSKAELPEIKEHMDLKKPVEVRYKGTAPPYEVVSAH